MTPSSRPLGVQRKPRRRQRRVRRMELLEERHLLASGWMFLGPEPVVILASTLLDPNQPPAVVVTPGASPVASLAG